MNANPVTVLVIESHPMMRDALSLAIIDAIDLQVTLQAGSVAEALELVKGMIPDVILLALGHAGEGDANALTVLRKVLPVTPILALTSNEVLGQELAALKHGAQVVLSKAAARAELIDALRTLYVLSKQML